MPPPDWFVALAPQLAGLVPLLPVLAAAGIAAHASGGQAPGDAGERPTARMAVGAVLGALALMLGLDLLALLHALPGHVLIGNWFASGDVTIPLSLMLDRMGLALGTLVALIAWITLRFSVNYLHREPGFHRFFLAMSLFVAGMQLIVLAANAVLAFVGWELAGVSSYLLIGYAYERPTAIGNALFAFVANRIGDAGFVLSIALCVWWLGTTEWQALALGGALDKVTARLLLFGFVVAAFAKSAQVPFSPWIARALEGPTPSSAIFYGAVMVHAGVYLVIRLEPVLVQVPDIMVYVAGAGAATALYGYFAGLVQTDVKSALIFGTTTQVGLMFVACGMGWFELAAWHLGLHMAWRAYQFLMAPSYMHLVAEPARPAPRWLSAWRWLYTAALQRFWLDHLAQALIVRPVQTVGRDARALDDRVLSRLVGMADPLRGEGARDEDVILGRGVAGRALVWAADHLHNVESRLLLRRSDGAASRVLRRVGEALLVVEALLEQPRYLLLLVLITFAVIL
jgi:NADH:ubiquinone oxidoreductase subunit 5 (subunit L)/multisubunit Na+/H+ antiporter MnhA subunit